MASNKKMKKKNLSPEEKEEQEDKKHLAEANANIEDIMCLIAENYDRTRSTELVEKARTGLSTDLDGEHTQRLSGSVFHLYKGKRVALKLRNSKLFEIASALEIHIKTHSHGEDLQKALTGHIMRKIKLLEKQMRRISN